MFSEKRVIIVRNYLPLYKKASDAGADDLLKFAKEKQDTAVVIFVLEGRYAGDLTAYAKKLIKAASAYEFASLDKADLKSFILILKYSSTNDLAPRNLKIGFTRSPFFIPILPAHRRVSFISFLDA